MDGPAPRAVTIRENIVTEEPGLEDSGNTLLPGTPVFPVTRCQGPRRAKYPEKKEQLWVSRETLNMQFNLPKPQVPKLHTGT